MIDFTLTENDKAQLARTRAEALICRKYAREYEEREELPPDELPERAEFLASAEAVPESGPDDSPKPVMMALLAMGAYWGDYSIRLKQSGGGSATRLSARREPRSSRRSGAISRFRWRSPSRAVAPIPPWSSAPPSSTATSG